jgi:hypothetical protein
MRAITIVIPSYDSEKNKIMRDILIDSIQKQTRQTCVIVPIVDRDGYAQAVNKGIMRYPDNDVVIISDDVELKDELWLEKFQIILDMVKPVKVGIITASSARRKVFRKTDGDLVGYILGTIGFGYLSRDMLNDIGLLDTQFKYGEEEIDLAIRMEQKGYVLLTAPIKHRHKFAETMKDIPEIKAEFDKSHKLLLEKHGFQDDGWENGGEIGNAYWELRESELVSSSKKTQ